MNTNEKILEEEIKELKEENKRLKLEIIKLEEKNVNELKNLEEENKELKEENNRLKLEIIKLKNKKTDNKQINEINDSKLEEKEDNSINIFFNSDKKENPSFSNSIEDNINSISFIEAFIGKLKNYSFFYNHFICKKCNKVPRIEFVDLKNLNYTCSCHEDKNLGFDIIKEKSITEFENDKGDITKYLKCQIHHKKYHYYCKYCNVNLCRECLSQQIRHRYHALYLFDLHIFETNEII
jgi:hypothetical protein